MPWRIKRQWFMILLGVAALSLGVIALALNRADIGVDRLLAIGLIIGGAAIVLNILPTNGHDKDD